MLILYGKILVFTVVPTLSKQIFVVFSAVAGSVHNVIYQRVVFFLIPS